MSDARSNERRGETELEGLVQNLFLEALEVPAEGRGAWLAERCGDDAELRAALEERLRFDADTLSRLEPPALRGLLLETGAAGEEVGGERSYRLISELGQGGMGAVWLAERADGEFRQQVAIKLLAKERRPDLVQRFRTERQILASLDHPGIAKLLDGGTLPNGTPYLVMEHVDGVRIDEFCRARQLSVRARVELFLGVCAAVGAAHQRLIVHRDLKPGNILVTADGLPKLLDFGIAKLLDKDRLDFTLAETELGRTPLTLRYASPEQVMGEPIGTTSDVYSLGVVFYELLAERSPYDTGGELSTAALAQRICGEEPPPAPSTRASAATGPSEAEPRRLAQLQGDLDAIVLKALRKEPAARYPSVAALEEDLRRYLDGFPVLARKGNRLYAAGKFIRRHRLPLAAALLLFATISAAAITSYRQARALEAERDRVVAAEKRTREKEESARQVTRFLVEILQGADPERNQGREPSLREVLDRGAQRVKLELADQPAIAAPLLEAISAVYRRLGQLEQSRALAEEAVALRRGMADHEPLALAEALSEWGLLEQAAGRHQRAEQLFREALAIDERHPGAGDARVPQEKHRLGSLLVEMSRVDEAEPLLDEVLRSELRRFGFAGLPLDLEGRQVTADYERLHRALIARGHVASFKGDAKAALPYYQDALALARAIFGPQHSRVASVLNSMVGPLATLGENQRALETIDQAIAIQKKVFGPRHPQIANVLANRASVLGIVGRWSEVEATAAESLDIARATLGEDHPTTLAVQGTYCTALANQGRREEALRLYRQVLARCLRVQGEESECAAIGRMNVGDLLLQLGRRREAEGELQKAVLLARKLFEPVHPWRQAAESKLEEARRPGG